MGEQVAVEGRVLVKERVQVESALGGYQLIEAYLFGGDRGPLLLQIAVVRIGAGIADALEDHLISLGQVGLLGSKRRGVVEGFGGCGAAAGWDGGVRQRQRCVGCCQVGGAGGAGTLAGRPLIG